MRSTSRSILALTFGAIALVAVLGSATPGPRKAGEPDVPGRTSAVRARPAHGLKSAATARKAVRAQVRQTGRTASAAPDRARAVSRPTRLDPLMAL